MPPEAFCSRPHALALTASTPTLSRSSSYDQLDVPLCRYCWSEGGGAFLAVPGSNLPALTPKQCLLRLAVCQRHEQLAKRIIFIYVLVRADEGFVSPCACIGTTQHVHYKCLVGFQPCCGQQPRLAAKWQYCCLSN